MLRRTVLAAGSGLALALAFEPLALALLIPLAVTGLALCTRGLRLRSGWVPGLAFGVAFYFTHIIWMRAVGTDAWLALAGIEAAFYAVLGSVWAALHRLRLWPLWLALAWVAMEIWRSGWPFSGMPWGRLAFGSIDTPVAPALAYVGMNGVSLLLALVGTLLAWLVVAGRGRRLPALASVVAVMGAACLPAVTAYTLEVERSTVVAAVQGDVPGPGNDILFDADGVTENHVEATVGLADRVASGEVERPELVVWPENSTASDPFRNQAVNSGIRAAVEAIGVPILVGAIVDAGEEHVLNQGIVWDPETGAGERYSKWHPVPYGEYIPFRRYFEGQFGRLALIPRDMLSGTRTEPLPVAGVAVADAICFDVAYDDGIHAQVENGAELLVVQTSNATFIETDQIDQQFAITRSRAVETGRWVVVAATNGVSGVIAPDGTVVSSASPRTQEVLVEEVELVRGVTPGVRLGPWVGRGSLVATGVGLLVSLILARRRGGPEDPPAERPEPARAEVTG